MIRSAQVHSDGGRWLYTALAYLMTLAVASWTRRLDEEATDVVGGTHRHV